MAKLRSNSSRGAPLSAPSKPIASIPNPIVCLVVAITIAALSSRSPAFAAEILRCARFDQGELPVPAPSPYPSAIARADRINHAVKSDPYSVVFFGDSLTEGWDTAVWQHYLAPRGVLNAGVSGDRTDNLLWRLEHGNLAGRQPKAVVLLIGTNDLAYGRSPARTADGIRANLEVLRQHLPEARILLLGLLPREAVSSASLRIEVAQVNQLIRDCADNQHVFYSEIGDVLLTSDGLLSAEISPDQLHFTARGYALLAARLEPELDRLLSAEH
jgi:lysophospholipase L1-like esterase